MDAPVRDGVWLSLPPRPELLPALLALAGELAGLAGLEAAGRESFLTALEAAGGWVLATAASAEGQPVRAGFRLTALGLEARLIDQGPPLHWVEAGLMLDGPALKATWRNLGRAGNELRLSAPLAHPAPDADQADGAAGRAIRVDPAARYDVRLMQAEDALAVCRAAWAAYGYTYPDPDFYQPQRLAALVAQGHLISAVAVDAAGGVLGHCALAVEDPAAGTAELGKGFVHPAWRGRGCLNAMSRFLVDAAAARGFAALTAHAVADHAMSQRSAARMGFTVCGLLPSYAPAVHYRSLAIQEAERVPVVMACRALGRPWPRPALPASHAALLGAIYDALGCPPAPAGADAAAAAPAPLGCGVLGLGRSALTQSAAIRVEEIGAGSAAEVRRLLRAAHLGGVEVVTLSLPLGRPGLEALLAAAGELGFFFAGLAPEPGQGDRLLLQHLGSLVVDYDRLVLAPGLGQQIAAYVRGRDPNQPEATPPACALS